MLVLDEIIIIKNMKIYYYDVRSVGIDDDVTRYWGYKVMNSIEGIEVVGDVSECDYVVMRKTYTSNYHDLNKRVCEELKQYSGRYGKQFVYFLHDDPVEDMGDCVDGGIIFRTSYNRSEGRINEYCMPFSKEMICFCLSFLFATSTPSFVFKLYCFCLSRN